MSEQESRLGAGDDRDDASAAEAESSTAFPDVGVERDMTDDRNAIRALLEAAKREYEELGGWDAFKSGEWLLILIQRSFRDYWERATVEYFCAKYGTTDPDKISAKLISVASKNAAILGAVTGAAVSADEIVALLTAAEAGIGLPANLLIAAAALSGEAILLVRFQLQLVANLGKLYGVPLDPDDPEDILTILAFAIGGSAADAAGKAGAKVGGRLGGRAAKAVFKKELLKALKRVGNKVGVKILQGTIVKYVVPIVSIGIGTGWNYVATRSVGRVAIRHFKRRMVDLHGAAETLEGTRADLDNFSAWEVPQAEDEDGVPGIGGPPNTGIERTAQAPE